EQAFRKIKAAFTEAPILRHYQLNARLRLETNASQFAISAIYPIAFWLRKLILAEVNYETYDQELLAIIEGFKQFRYYLEGA
ncbi:MAG: hypothetical protein FE78DRAFT_114743, partial [Acidomyces sp. 'richmondensis']